MFTNSTSLVGGNGTTYDYSHVSTAYARVDGVNGQPGYFTSRITVKTAAEFQDELDAVTASLVAVSVDGWDVESIDQWTVQTARNGIDAAIAAAEAAIADDSIDDYTSNSELLATAAGIYDAAKRDGLASREHLASTVTSASAAVVPNVSVDGSDVWSDEQWVTQAQQDAYGTAISTAQAVVDDSNATAFAAPTRALRTAMATYDAAKSAGLKHNGNQGDVQTYGAPAGSETYAWDPVSNDGNGGAGQIQLVYSTLGSTWDEPGADPADDGDNVTHDVGSYVLTVPKLISYTEMNVGTVSTSNSYTVNVKGVLDSGKQVNVTATPDGTLVNGSQAISDDSSIAVALTHAKSTWSATDTFGTQNADGSLSGTDATDNIAMSGIAKSQGTWKGIVQYTASLVDAA